MKKMKELNLIKATHENLINNTHLHTSMANIRYILDKNKDTFERFESIIPIINKNIGLLNPERNSVYDDEVLIIDTSSSVISDPIREIPKSKEENIYQKVEKNINKIIFNEEEKTLIRKKNNHTFVFKFHETGMNFKLFNILANNIGYKQTRRIREEIVSKSDEAVRKKVGVINQAITKKLKIGEKIIIGESGAGYRINPDISIVVK